MSTYSSVEDGLENEEVNYKSCFLKGYMNIKESFVLCWKEEKDSEKAYER